jgi:hypothetical protein
MTALIKRLSVSEPYLRSARQTRFFFSGRRILFFRLLAAVARTCVATLLDAARVELAAHDGVLDTDIFHSAAAEHDHRVFLQIVPLARDVGGDLHAVGEADAGDLADGGVRLSRGLGRHLGADAALEGRGIKGRAIRECVEAARQSRHGRLARFIFAAFFGKLIDGCHLENPPRRDVCTIYKPANKCKLELYFSSTGSR